MYHSVLLIKLPDLVFTFLEYKEQIYDFINCDYYRIRSSIASIDWNVLLKCLNFNDAVNVFYENIFKTIDLKCPKINLCTQKYPLWFSTILK